MLSSSTTTSLYLPGTPLSSPLMQAHLLGLFYATYIMRGLVLVLIVVSLPSIISFSSIKNITMDTNISFKTNRWSRIRLNHPSTQNAVAGVGLGFSAGVFVALNLLGAGGGQPDSAHVIQMANAILSSVWFLSASVGGTYLSFLGPAITMAFGICTYALYVGALWYYEAFGNPGFPLIAGAMIGIGAGAVFITTGHIQVAYSDEMNKGRFIAVQNSLQACTYHHPHPWFSVPNVYVSQMEYYGSRLTRRSIMQLAPLSVVYYQ